MKDKAGSFFHAKLKLSFGGHTATLVPDNDKKVNLLLSNGALVRVDEEEALNSIKEAKGKVRDALNRDNRKKAERSAILKGLTSNDSSENKAIATPASSKPAPKKVYVTPADTDPKSDANIETLIEEGLTLEVLERKGSWYKFEDNAIDQGMPETVKKLQEDGELYLKILQAIEAKRA